MNADVVIVGAGPAGIFTALEMIKKGSRQKIVMVEKGQPVEKRHCPKDKTKKCVNCKPYCHITTGFSAAAWLYSCYMMIATQEIIDDETEKIRKYDKLHSKKR